MVCTEKHCSGKIYIAEKRVKNLAPQKTFSRRGVSATRERINTSSCLVVQTVNCLSTMRETWVRSLGWEDSLEKEMATHSSTLALKSHGRRSLVQATVHGVAKSRVRLSDFTFTFTWVATLAWSRGISRGSEKRGGRLDRASGGPSLGLGLGGT